MIAPQYADPAGQPSMDIRYNPNGSRLRGGGPHLPRRPGDGPHGPRRAPRAPASTKILPTTGQDPMFQSAVCVL